MAVLLFWNVRGSEVAEPVAILCRQYGVDVLMLAEQGANTAQMLRRLNTGEGAPYWELRSPVKSQIRFWTRYPVTSITPVFDDGRVSIRHLRAPVGAPMLIAAVHMPSKLHMDDQDQYYRMRRL